MDPLVLEVVYSYGLNLLHQALKGNMHLLRQLLFWMYDLVFGLELGS